MYKKYPLYFKISAEINYFFYRTVIIAIVVPLAEESDEILIFEILYNTLKV